MIFTEWCFFLFFGVVLAVHWSLGSNRWRKLWLLAASYFFYGVWDWRFLFLIFATTLLDFVCGARLTRVRSSTGRRALLLLSLVGNLGSLAFFK